MKHSSNYYGRIGEQAAKNYLEQQGWKVEDLTLCRDFWTKDIDFRIEKNGIQFYIEVKNDNVISKTGNMFVETITDIDTGKSGYFNFCSADFIFYGDNVNQIFYVFRLDDLKRYVKENVQTLAERKAADYNDRGQIRKCSQGYLVPIGDFRSKYPVKVIRL